MCCRYLHARHDGLQRGLPVTNIMNAFQIDIIQEKCSVFQLEYFNILNKFYLHFGYRIYSIQNYKFRIISQKIYVNFCFSMDFLFWVVILLKVFSKCHLLFANAYSWADSSYTTTVSTSFKPPEMNPFSKNIQWALWTPPTEHIHIASKNVMQLTLSIFHFQLEFPVSTIPTSFALLPCNLCVYASVFYSSQALFIYMKQ